MREVTTGRITRTYVDIVDGEPVFWSASVRLIGGLRFTYHDAAGVLQLHSASRCFLFLSLPFRKRQHDD